MRKIRKDVERREVARLSGLPHVAIYGRVSTGEQARHGDSINQQPRMCVELLEREFGKGGFTYELFVDAGKSGSLGPFAWDERPRGKHRPELWRLIQGVRDERFTHVCAYRIDRLYRRIEGWAAFRNMLLEETGVKVLFVAERFDDSLTGGLAADLMARVAQFQREITVENIVTAMDRRRAEGHWMGPAPYGWRSTGSRRREGQ
jgi:DNA invertase Pin-like site-specific DNA recombinase